MAAQFSRLSLLGNPLRCDCKALWLRRLLDRPGVTVALPPCFSPFSRYTQQLQAFEGRLGKLFPETDVFIFCRKQSLNKQLNSV